LSLLLTLGLKSLRSTKLRKPRFSLANRPKLKQELQKTSNLEEEVQKQQHSSKEPLKMKSSKPSTTSEREIYMSKTMQLPLKIKKDFN